jgi:polar amino acid transport system substrate-binding protein
MTLTLNSMRQLFAVVGLIVSGALSSAMAQDPAEFGCDRPVHLAFYEFGSLYHDGVGIDPDVIDELARRTGCTFKTELLPRAQIWQELKDAQLDMATSGIRTPTRRAFAYFIPYVGLKNVLIVSRDIGSSIKSFDDIVANPDWRIGVVKGYVHGPYFDYRLGMAAADGRVLPYPDQDSIYRALRSGEVQAVISPAPNFEFYFSPDERQQYMMIDVSPAPPIGQALILSVARFTAPQINALTRVMEQMAMDGTLEKIFLRHNSAGVAHGMLEY